MSVRPLKIAVLGTGAIVERAHLPGLAADGAVEIHLAGRNAARLAELSQAFSVHRTWADSALCLAQSGLDGVVIATPNFLHADAARTAIAQGLPILLEKPLSNRIEEARDIVSRAGAAGVPIRLNLPQRHRPSVLLMRRAIAEGRLGRLRSIDLSMTRRHGIPGFGTWFTRKETAGGGVLADLGPHLIDLALFLSGTDSIISASGRVWADHGPRGTGLGDWTAHAPVLPDPARQFDVEDRARICLTLASGTEVTCEVAWALHGCDENRIRVIGEDGGLDYWPEGNSGGPVLRAYPEDLCATDIPADHDNLGPAWRQVVADFISQIRGGTPLSDGPQALRVAEIIESVYQSPR